MKHVKNIEINVIAVAIHLLLLDRAGTLASLLYKAEKPSVCPSVRLCHRIISVVFAWIDLRLNLCISEVFKTCIDVFSSI